MALSKNQCIEIADPHQKGTFCKTYYLKKIIKRSNLEFIIINGIATEMETQISKLERSTISSIKI